jgi:hypothetical protein
MDEGEGVVLQLVDAKGDGWGYLHVCVLIRISDMGVYVSVNISFICRPLFVKSYI